LALAILFFLQEVGGFQVQSATFEYVILRLCLCSGFFTYHGCLGKLDHRPNTKWVCCVVQWQMRLGYLKI
jgi:hypothetical protein